MLFSGLSRKGLLSAITSTGIIIISLTAGAALGASGESEGGVTVIPDWSVIIQIANFLIIIYILNLLLYRPIRKILKQRKETFQNLELSIETLGKDSEDKETAFAEGIRAARAKGLKEKEALIEAAGKEENAMIEKINQDAQAELAEVRNKVAKETESVRDALATQIDEFATAICQKIIGRTLS
jgi:F-type H+-transporting ATPase subunit b